VDDLEVMNAMEGNEVILRIVWRHRWLLLIMVLLPMAVVLPWRLTQPVTYAATADVQTQAAAPSASTQVSSILSQVSVIATSPEVVQKAIHGAKVDRNAVDVAKRQVSTASLDSSAIVAVTVKDPDRQVAARLSQALAVAIVGALNAPGTAASQQLTNLTRQEAQLNARRLDLLSQLDSDQARNLATTDPQVQASITELAGVEAQLSTNAAAQQQVISNSNASQDASVISEPTVATTTSASRQVPVYVVLAGLLGLILGLLIATIDELVRPTLADPEAGARELGVAFLGNAEITQGENVEADLIALEADLVTSVQLAADRLGAVTVVVTGAMPSMQLTKLAAEMNQKLPAADNSLSQETRPRPNGLSATGRNTVRNGRKTNRSPAVNAPAFPIGSAPSTLKVHALSDLTLRSRPRAPSLLVVLRRFAPRASLDRVADLGETTGWPILGVAGVRLKPRARGIWSVRKSPVAASRSVDRNSLTTPSAATQTVYRRVRQAQ
jgi:capsular polysaccharide biosynthesis protein